MGLLMRKPCAPLGMGPRASAALVAALVTVACGSGSETASSGSGGASGAGAPPGGWGGGGAAATGGGVVADAGPEPPPCPTPPATGWQSNIVHYDATGHLVYESDENQNRVPDFSYAGYRNGDVPLPSVPMAVELSPVSGDNTASIQAAIDQLAGQPADANGFRGAVVLAAGTWEIAGTIYLNASGIVLRGAGRTDDPAAATILRATGNTPAHREVIVAGSGTNDRWAPEVAGTRTNITTDFVPVGSREVQVESTAALHVGDNVIIHHPCTQAWIDAVDKGGASTGVWNAGDLPIVFNRRIVAIDGNTVRIDAPAFNHLDRLLSQSYLYVADRAGVVTNVGIENVRVDIVAASSTDENHAWSAIALVGVEDAWVSEVSALHFGYAAVTIRTGTRITCYDVHAINPAATVVGGNMYNFDVSGGQQVLFTGCHAQNGRHHYVSNGTTYTSGVVFHRSTSSRAYDSSEGHRRWSMGLLYDNIAEDNPHNPGDRLIGLYNRGTWGTVHGWAAAHSVAWNYDTSSGHGIIQRPPTAQNYAIGGKGQMTGTNPPAPFDGPPGYIEGIGQAGLVPESLYEAQLLDRRCAPR